MLCHLVSMGLDHLVRLSAPVHSLEGHLLVMGTKNYMRLACVASTHIGCLYAERLMWGLPRGAW